MPEHKPSKPFRMAKRRAISEARILEISNDISEGMCKASATELVEVVKYFRGKFDHQLQARQAERGQIALDLLDLAHPLLNGKVK